MDGFDALGRFHMSTLPEVGTYGPWTLRSLIFVTLSSMIRMLLGSYGIDTE